MIDVMKILTIAMMRPDISVDALRVRTYREMLDVVMKEVACGSIPSKIIQIEKELKEKLSASNIHTYGNSINI